MSTLQGDHGLLLVDALVRLALPALGLALHVDGVHARDADTEDRLDGFLDLRLGGVVGDLEDHGVVFRRQGSLLGDVRCEHDVVVTRFHFLLLSH